MKYIYRILLPLFIVSPIAFVIAEETPSDIETCIVSESEQDPFALKAEGSHQEAGALEDCVISEDEQEPIAIAHAKTKEIPAAADSSLFAPLLGLIKKIGAAVSAMITHIINFFASFLGKK